MGVLVHRFSIEWSLKILLSFRNEVIILRLSWHFNVYFYMPRIPKPVVFSSEELAFLEKFPNLAVGAYGEPIQNTIF